MAFNPMDLNNDGRVDFTDYMLFNTFINPARPDPFAEEDDDQLQKEQDE